MFLSIDFEDFSHDLKRDLGVWDTGPLRVDALWRSYEAIASFLGSHGGPNGQNVTFFCTGVVAEYAPDLVAHIAGQGHEIACHYHFHDSMDRQSTQTINEMLMRAKDKLQEAANTPVRGFRAPKFRLNRDTPEQYKLIERHFDYDSSSFFETADQCLQFSRSMSLSKLQLIPLLSSQYKGRGPQIRLGGTYLKFAPDTVARDLIAQANSSGMTPQIYLHPYEIVEPKEFWVRHRDLARLGTGKATYWAMRQNQWLRFGSTRLLGKLARLIPPDGLSGRLDQLVTAQ
ncbi:polysaccharide deacetylase family protein [Rhodobacteraceae bacterium B1Z28]|uniref:Chitooligosaccharide deacetylase n=1 Tax=Ruegeria haliotis TaxID=2747601 RepID=A0ABX2PQH3_9RHOB|nr:polysaccharide deacetylase family protein [Ruegeria haliotis]NVO56396.1 polysaccharide deacetylase family protein [Ruegeria haliotis]